MRPSWKFLTWTGIAVAFGFGLRYLLVGLAYSMPEVTVQELGGMWETETTRSLGGSTGGQTALYRENSGQSRQLVAPIVYMEQYVGDDCVVFGTPRDLGGPGCWIACQDRPSLMIVADYCIRWRISGDFFEKLELTKSGEPELFRLSELKSRALAGR